MSSTPPPLPSRPRSPLRWLPPALSAFVWPGVGQLAQKRWAMGLLVIAAFTTTAAQTMIPLFQRVAYVYKDAFGSRLPQEPPPSMGSIGLAFLCTASIYALSLWDTLRADRKP